MPTPPAESATTGKGFGEGCCSGSGRIPRRSAAVLRKASQQESTPFQRHKQAKERRGERLAQPTRWGKLLTRLAISAFKTPKLYFYDTGLLCWALGIRSPAQLDTHPLRGAIFECWVWCPRLSSSTRTAASRHDSRSFANRKVTNATWSSSRAIGSWLSRSNPGRSWRRTSSPHCRGSRTTFEPLRAAG